METLAALRRLLCCCKAKGHKKRSLEISYPTDVRRVDICMSGLSEEHQAFIREKAAADASYMFPSASPISPSSAAHLNLLGPSSSLTQSRPESPAPPTPTTTRTAHSHTSPQIKVKSLSNQLRRLSGSISLPYGYKSLHSNSNVLDGSISMDSLGDTRKVRGEGFEVQGVKGGVNVDGEERDSVTLGRRSESDGEGERGKLMEAHPSATVMPQRV